MGIAHAITASSGLAPRWRNISASWYLILLLMPAIAFLVLFFFVPSITLLSYSFLTQNERGIIGLPVTLSHFQRFVDVALYPRVLATTLRISAWTCLAAILIGYPVAIAIVRSRPSVSRLISMVIIAPLIVSVIVRAYGWQLILLNSNTGALNWVLSSLGLISAPLSILYTEAAVVIGQLHVNLPMMVLPLAAAIGKVDPALEDAARTLGAPWWRVFLSVTLPLSMPGLVAGITLVFSLTAGAFVTPIVLGGAEAMMLGNLIEQQIFTVFDWPFGAVIAFVLVTIVVGVNGLLMRVLETRRFRQVAR